MTRTFQKTKSSWSNGWRISGKRKKLNWNISTTTVCSERRHENMTTAIVMAIVTYAMETFNTRSLLRSSGQEMFPSFSIPCLSSSSQTFWFSSLTSTCLTLASTFCLDASFWSSEVGKGWATFLWASSGKKLKRLWNRVNITGIEKVFIEIVLWNKYLLLYHMNYCHPCKIV